MPLSKSDLENVRQLLIEFYEVVIAPRFDGLDKDTTALKDGQKASEVGQQQLHVGQKQLKAGQHRLEIGQTGTNRRLSAVGAHQDIMEGKLESMHSDIVELYGLSSKAS